MNIFPFTCNHELNIDKFIKKTKENTDAIAELSETIEGIDEDIEAVKQDVEDVKQDVADVEGAVEDLADDLDGKRDKITDDTKRWIYARNLGTESMFAAEDAATTANTIVLRDSNGRIKCADPVALTDAVNLNYFNEHGGGGGGSDIENLKDSEGIGAVQTVHRHDKSSFEALDGTEITLSDDDLAVSNESVVLNGYSKIEQNSKLSTAIGNKNYIINASAGFAAGDTNEIDGGSYSAVFGYGNMVKGQYSMAEGGDNVINEDCTRVHVAGASNTITGSSQYTMVTGAENIATDSTSDLVSGYANGATGTDSNIVSGNSNSLITAKNSIVSGDHNTVYGNNGLVIGYNNSINNGADDETFNNFITGASNAINGFCSYSTLIGTNNTITNTPLAQSNLQQMAIGSGNVLGNGNNGIVVGRNNTISDGVYNSQIFGQGNTCSGSNQTYIGQYANTNSTARVVIGNGTSSSSKSNGILIYNDRVTIPITLELGTIGTSNNSAVHRGYVDSNTTRNHLIQLLPSTPTSGSWTIDDPNIDWTELMTWAQGGSTRIDIRVKEGTGVLQPFYNYHHINPGTLTIKYYITSTAYYELSADGTYTVVN